MLAIPGKLNVKAGVVMLLAAIVLGLILSQVQPLPLAPPEASGIPARPLSWQEVPKQKYAWHICYAFLGNMGLVNIGGGLALVALGSRFTAGRLLSQILLLGGMLHPASWALVALTGLEGWNWLGNIGAAAVALVVATLFVHLLWATYCSGQALQRQTRSRLSR
ncbi:hypothetical protein NW814_05825 [Synechococcus sp. R65.1]|jgi:hypothetical protein|uniref:hypothetical protein n=1 Tax=unclassified Synechococcus TaxID=2626047 RepID=UPI0039C1F2CC